MRGGSEMASTTAEVMLYFGTDDKDFQRTVNEIRFSDDPSLDAREIIELLKPIYMRGYYEGKADGVLQS
jgi:hypothetical protein